MDENRVLNQGKAEESDALQKKYDFLKNEYDVLATRVLQTQALLASPEGDDTVKSVHYCPALPEKHTRKEKGQFKVRRTSFFPVVTNIPKDGNSQDAVVFGMAMPQKSIITMRSRSSSLGSTVPSLLPSIKSVRRSTSVFPEKAASAIEGVKSEFSPRTRKASYLEDEDADDEVAVAGAQAMNVAGSNDKEVQEGKEKPKSLLRKAKEDEPILQNDPSKPFLLKSTRSARELSKRVVEPNTCEPSAASEEDVEMKEAAQGKGKTLEDGYVVRMVDDDVPNLQSIHSGNLVARFCYRISYWSKTYPVLHPNSKRRQYWNLVMLCILCYYTFLLPFRVGFNVGAYGVWFVMETVFDMLFILDIFSNFATGYSAKHQVLEVLVLNRWMIVKHYLRTWFVVDFVSSIPIDLILLLTVPDQRETDDGAGLKLTKLLRLLKLFRLIRILGMSRYLKVWTEKLKPSFMRVLKVPVVVVICAHWLACFFFWLTSYNDDLRETWADASNVRYASVSTQYITSVYWSISTMTTVGYGDVVAKSPEEKLFSIVSMLLASSMFAYFVGNIAQLLSSVDATTSMYKDKMEFVREYMEYQQLPADLQQRIKLFYGHCWKRLKSFPYSEDAILDELTASLRREVVLYLNRDMVEKVPFFENQDDNFISNLILVMKFEICAPRDVIITEGDMGHCMYFLRRGMVEVCSGDGQKIYATLSDGAFFGEVSLLVSGRRTASVRAVYHCDLLSLQQDDLDRVLSDYPEAMEKIVKMAADSKYHLSSTDRDLLQERFETIQAHMQGIASDMEDGQEEEEPQAAEVTSPTSPSNRRDTNLNFHKIVQKLREKKRGSSVGTS